MSKFSKLIQKQKEAKATKQVKFNLEAKTNANRELVLCSCGSKVSYKQCCGVLHLDASKAKTPLQLMKSRYTAFTQANISYLLNTHHISTRPIKDADEMLKWATSVVWLRLEIIEESVVENNIGYITFKAHFIENGIAQVIYEKSRFVKENNYWFYKDGKHF